MRLQLIIKAAVSFLISIKDLSCLRISDIFRKNFYASIVERFLIFVWNLLDIRTWRWFYHRASDGELRMLKRSVRERDASDFETIVEMFSKRKRLESAVLEINFQDVNGAGSNKNLLEEILSMLEEDANAFYMVLMEKASAYTFCYLLKYSNHPHYVLQNPDLLDRILYDCKFIPSAVNIFCSVQGNCGETVLHAAAKTNIQLCHRIIQCLEYSTDFHRGFDFVIFTSFLNISAVMLVWTLTSDYYIILVARLIVFLVHHFLYNYDLVELLHCRDQTGKTVFEVVAKKDKQLFLQCVEIINEQAKFNISNFETYLFRTCSQTFAQIIHGRDYITACALIIYILLWAYDLLSILWYGKTGLSSLFIIPYNLDSLIRTGLAIIHALCFCVMCTRADALEALLLVIVPLRLFIHILWMPWRGVSLSAGLIIFNIASYIFLIRFWRSRCHTLIELETFYNYSVTGIQSLYLTTARSDVTLAVLDEILKNNQGFLYDRTLQVLKIPDVYRCLICDDKVEANRRIKDKLRQISKMNDEHLNVITDCTRFHVVVLSVLKDRIDAPQELKSIEVMSAEMDYTLHPHMDVSDGKDIQLMLEETLSGIIDADLVLVFIMGHGSDDEIFGYSGTGIHISKIIETVRVNLPENMSKSLYVQTCRTLSAQLEKNPILASDPLAEKTYVTLQETSQMAPDSIYKCLEGSKNMLVHTATKKGDVAIQDTFVSLLADELRCKNKLFICLNEASVATTDRCKGFSDCQLYQSPSIDRMCKIRVPHVSS